MIAALLDHLWQSTLFAACAGLLTLALRDNGACTRYWLWFAASVKFLMPLSLLIAIGGHLTLPLPTSMSGPPVVGAALQLTQPFSASSPAGAVPPETRTVPTQAKLNATSILLTIWVAGFAAVVLIWLVRWSRINAVMHSAVPLSLKPPLSVSVKTSSSILEPGLVGIWRPSILLPAGIETRLSDHEMDSVFAHELSHLRRRDNLTATIHMLVEALFWFYPLVWWLGARLIAEREHACDESVLASGRDPKIYAESILKVCRFYVQSPLACTSGVSGADLKKRVETIMINRPATKLNFARKCLLTASAAIAVASPVLAGLSGSHHAVAQTQNDSAWEKQATGELPADVSMPPANKPSPKVGRIIEYDAQVATVECKRWEVTATDKDGSYIAQCGDNISYHTNGNLTKVVSTTGNTLMEFKPHTFGLSFPIEVGKKWDGKYTGYTAYNRASWNGDASCEVKSSEIVTVPAGQFDAYRIDCVDNWESGGLSGQVHYSSWYAPKVGTTVKFVSPERPEWDSQVTSISEK